MSNILSHNLTWTAGHYRSGFSLKPHLSGKEAVVPLYLFKHLGLIVVKLCCQVTLFCCVSSLSGTTKEKKNWLLYLSWIIKWWKENKMFVRCAVHQFPSTVCPPCQKNRRKQELEAGLIIEKKQIGLLCSVWKIEQTGKWFVQFLCVCMHMKYKEKEADRKEKHSTCQSPCQSQSIWHFVLRERERDEGGQE